MLHQTRHQVLKACLGTPHQSTPACSVMTSSALLVLRSLKPKHSAVSYPSHCSHLNTLLPSGLTSELTLRPLSPRHPPLSPRCTHRQLCCHGLVKRRAAWSGAPGRAAARRRGERHWTAGALRGPGTTDRRRRTPLSSTATAGGKVGRPGQPAALLQLSAAGAQRTDVGADRAGSAQRRAD